VYMLIKRIAIIFFIIFGAFSYSSEIVITRDTVNIRKVFFSKPDADWYQYSGKRLYFEGEQTVLYINTDEAGNWEIRFYNSESEPDDTFAFGRIIYNYNSFKELQNVSVYIHRNNNSYIYFDRRRPGKCDLYLFGLLYKRDIPYYFDINLLTELPLSSILNVIRYNNYYNEVMIFEDDRSLKERFIRSIIYPSISDVFVDDGARNQLGDFVYIRSGNRQTQPVGGLNCSGFAKEVADTYIRLADRNHLYMPIDLLKTRRLNERRSELYSYYEEEYDPYFGRDWVKNIGDEINRRFRFTNITARELNSDRYSQYYEGRGFRTEDLKGVLLRDQKQDNGYFYMVVFNRMRNTSPVIPEFYHTAVLVTHFNNNHFYIRVFESNTETSFSNISSVHNASMAFVYKIPISYSEFFREYTPYIEEQRFIRRVLNRTASASDRNFLTAIYSLDRVSRIYFINRELSRAEKDRVIEIFEKAGFYTPQATIHSLFD